MRASIKGGGCAGFSYRLDLIDKPTESDLIFESNGIQLVCDPKSYLYIDGTIIGFSGQIKDRGFIFSNPNAKQTCPCGASFAV